MLDLKSSRVAEMVFNQNPGFSLAQIVAEFDQVLARSVGPDRQLSWDCDDVAMFDIPGCRILIALYEPLNALDGHHVVVGVGPSPVPSKARKQVGFKALCDKIVSRIADHCVADEILQHEVQGVLTAEVIDDLGVDSGKGRWSMEPWRPAYAMGTPSADLSTVRAALYPQNDAEELTQIASRMANHAIDLTASLVAVPGALASLLFRRSAGYAADPR